MDTRDDPKTNSPIETPSLPRRHVLGLAAALAAGVGFAAPVRAAGEDDACDDAQALEQEDMAQTYTLPVDRIQQIVGAEGTVSHGVLDISIARDDIGNVHGPRGVTFTPAFELHGDLYFQPVGQGRALLNGDMALLPDEVNPFISAVLKQGLVFQAYHQHLIQMDPQIWFVHYRGVGDPLELARKAHAVISVTGAPLPQKSPQNPKTPLDPDKLAQILHGEAEVGEEGVVTVSVSRKHGVRLGGVYARPETGISTTIEFKPLGGARAVVVPDFSMIASEIVPVVQLMLNELHWFQGCLYNQETDEHPQLYFDHMLKTGDAYELAREIRRGLNRTASE